jgi:hypothetical protein
MGGARPEDFMDEEDLEVRRLLTIYYLELAQQLTLALNLS